VVESALLPSLLAGVVLPDNLCLLVASVGVSASHVLEVVSARKAYAREAKSPANGSDR
jgi:uncharacterized DUF497 family protein